MKLFSVFFYCFSFSLRGWTKWKKGIKNERKKEQHHGEKSKLTLTGVLYVFHIMAWRLLKREDNLNENWKYGILWGFERSISKMSLFLNSFKWGKELWRPEAWGMRLGVKTERAALKVNFAWNRLIQFMELKLYTPLSHESGSKWMRE